METKKKVMDTKKEKGRQWDGVSRPSNDTYAKNWHDIFGKKEKSLHEELMEGYEEEKKNETQ